MTYPAPKSLKLTNPFVPKVCIIDERAMRGMAVRLDMLMTHYRKPKDFQTENLNSSARILRRWYARMELTLAPPPVAFVEAMCDDLNTPKAIALLHVYARDNPQALYAGMAMLGLIPDHLTTLPDELKSIPIDHLPLPQWEWDRQDGGIA